MVGTLIDVRISDDDENTLRWALDQTARGFESCRASAFRADERAGDVEAVFREKVVEVVAGDAAWDVWEFLADQVGVLIGDLLEGGAELSDASGIGAVHGIAAARYFWAAGQPRAAVPT